MILWITGLSGTGKTTLAREVHSRLEERDRPAVLLDGDELRAVFGALSGENQSFERDSRLRLALLYGRLCRMLGKQDIDVVIATISLFNEVHEWNREYLRDYYQVYLRVPMAVLRQRDSKGIYRCFDNGLINNVAGLDLEIEEPDSPDWAPDFDSNKSVSVLADEMMLRLTDRNLL